MLRIGPFEFEFPVVQAALSGYSDGPMRLIARGCGAPYAVHELVLDKLLLQPGKLQRKIIDIDPADHPVGGQLMGSEPTQFAAAAALMAESGFDVVDINFGCPVKKVLGRCRGGFLLSDPDTAIEIIRAVRAEVPPAVPVTLKMRRGMDDSQESVSNFLRIFDFAWEAGVAAITVHGRTVEQRYIGRSNWTFLENIKRRAGERAILGSGDLFVPGDIVRMLEETGVDGVTVARGCIGNPWIFSDTQHLMQTGELPEPPSVVEQGRVIRRHFELCEQLHGERGGPRLMRKFGIKYSQLHPHAEPVREAFIRCSTRQQWLAILDEWYDPRRAWPPGVRRIDEYAVETAGCDL
jgi:tRNA-dihydrouridine synthase B